VAAQLGEININKAQTFSYYLVEKEIENKLQEAYDPASPPECPYPQNILSTQAESAAVLIPILRRNDEWHILFIRRTQNESDRHRGQVAFPGGCCEPEDLNAEQTALREAFEETGIKPDDVKILGYLREILTITNYRVTPVVGLISWPYTLTPQIDEVSRIFTIPLKWLGFPSNHEVRKREIPGTTTQVPVIYFTPYDGEILWGASARITLLLLEVLNISKPKNRYK